MVDYEAEQSDEQLNVALECVWKDEQRSDVHLDSRSGSYFIPSPYNI